MSYSSNYNLNIRLSVLESKINGGGVLPTSSDLADVLLNGNSAGTTDIDMNGQSITATGLTLPLSASQITLTTPIFAGNNIDITSGSNLDLVASDNISASADAMTFTTTTGAIDLTGDSVNLTSIGNNISLTSPQAINITAGDGMYLTATDDIVLTSTADAITLNANLDVTLTATQGYINITSTNDEINLTANNLISLTSNTGNIELIPFNDDGVTESGIVRINKNNSLLGDGFLTAGTINISSDEIGSTISPQLTLTNLNATAGTTNGVPSVSFYKNGRNAGNNDRIGDLYFNANDTTSTKREFARIEVVTRNVGVGNEDGSISFIASLNGVPTEFLRINGADGDNNFLRPLDMNGSAINSTSGSLSISASGSSGAGTITLTPKPLGNLIFQNLPTSAVGLPTGAVWNNSGVLNIAP